MDNISEMQSQEASSEVRLPGSTKDSGLLGIAKDSKLTTEKFLEYKREEKAKEDENEQVTYNDQNP